MQIWVNAGEGIELILIQKHHFSFVPSQSNLLLCFSVFLERKYS